MNLPKINPETIQLAKQGNQEATQNIYQEMYPSTYTFFKDYFKSDLDQAKKLADESIHEALNNLDELQDDNAFNTHLESILKKKVVGLEKETPEIPIPPIQEEKVNIPPIPPKAPQQAPPFNYQQPKKSSNKGLIIGLVCIGISVFIGIAAIVVRNIILPLFFYQSTYTTTYDDYDEDWYSDYDWDEDNWTYDEDSNSTYTKYACNYNMKIRSEPDTNSTQVGHLLKGNLVTIIETTTGSNNSTWGKIDDNQWVLIQDDDCEYLTAQ